MESKLTFMQRVGVETLWAMCRLFGMLPLWVQYHVVAPVIRVLLLRVFRYRRGVVMEQLRFALPEKSEAEIRGIRNGFYRVLSEVFVSAIAIASPRMKGKFDDIDDMTTEAAKLREETKGVNCVIFSAHFGMWEHNMFWGEYSGNYTIGSYHKLKNPVMEELMLRLRTRNHPYVVAVESKNMLRFCLKNREGINGRNIVVGLIADQHPKRYPESNWIDFLGRETIFFEAGEKLALKLKYPVYFTYYKRHGAGKYSFVYHKLHDGVEQVEPFEITRRYVRCLEGEIRNTPEMWLWSHRRWKHKR